MIYKNYYLNLSLDTDKTIFVPGSDVSFVCKIRGKRKIKNDEKKPLFFTL